VFNGRRPIRVTSHLVRLATEPVIWVSVYEDDMWFFPLRLSVSQQNRLFGVSLWRRHVVFPLRLSVLTSFKGNTTRASRILKVVTWGKILSVRVVFLCIAYLGFYVLSFSSVHAYFFKLTCTQTRFFSLPDPNIPLLFISQHCKYLLNKSLPRRSLLFFCHWL
jgi:hypothetical protein